MKNKFQRMSKEEKKEAIKEYYAEKSLVASKYKKLKIVCIIGIVYSIIALIVDLYLHYFGGYHFYIQNLIIDCFLLIFCVSFLIASKQFLEKSINSYLVEKLRKEQIEKWKKEEELDKKQKAKENKTTRNSTKKETKKVEKKAKVNKNGKTTKSNS